MFTLKKKGISFVIKLQLILSWNKTRNELLAGSRDTTAQDALASRMKRFGFDPWGHSGKAMAHTLTALPHDLLVAQKLDDLERVTLRAMSLTDRPRPKLIALRSPLGRNLYIFVWLPSDDVSTGIRKQIQTMLMDATGGSLLG